MKKNTLCGEKAVLNVSGQAFENGILMRSPARTVLCMYDENQNIVSRIIKFDSIFKNPKYSKTAYLPIVRGIVSFSESLRLISQAFDTMSLYKINNTDKKVYFFKYAVFLLVFFFTLPIYFAELSASYNFKKEHTESFIRVLFFLIYTACISFSKKHCNILKYHGAEHKVINCYEKGFRLTCENTKRCSRVHYRCGTNIICIIVILYSIAVCLTPWSNTFTRLAGEFLLLPVIIGLSYEAVRAAAKSQSNILLSMVNIPGEALQLTTTKEPDEKHIRLAVEAFRICIRKNDESAFKNFRGEDVICENQGCTKTSVRTYRKKT